MIFINIFLGILTIGAAISLAIFLIGLSFIFLDFIIDKIDEINK